MEEPDENKTSSELSLKPSLISHFDNKLEKNWFESRNSQKLKFDVSDSNVATKSAVDIFKAYYNKILS